MKNGIRFTLKPKQRPKLAQKIGKILGTAPNYERVPSLSLIHIYVYKRQPVANEFDKTIWETFKVNHPNTHLIEGDIRQVTRDDIAQYIDGEVDGIIGGPPCQSWSRCV